MKWEDIKIEKGAQIVSVAQLSNYNACIHWEARVESSVDESFGRCSVQDCMTLQKVDFCMVHMCEILQAKSMYACVSVNI